MQIEDEIVCRFETIELVLNRYLGLLEKSLMKDGQAEIPEIASLTVKSRKNNTFNGVVYPTVKIAAKIKEGFKTKIVESALEDPEVKERFFGSFTEQDMDWLRSRYTE